MFSSFVLLDGRALCKKGMSYFESKLGQISLKWDKSGTFSGQGQYILVRYKFLEILSLFIIALVTYIGNLLQQRNKSMF